jgi:hypothetical protein
MYVLIAVVTRLTSTLHDLFVLQEIEQIGRGTALAKAVLEKIKEMEAEEVRRALAIEEPPTEMDKARSSSQVVQVRTCRARRFLDLSGQHVDTFMFADMVQVYRQG